MQKNKSINILISNTTWLYLGKLVTQLFSFVVSILVLKKISIDIYGTFSILSSTLTVIAIFTTDPIIDIIFRFLPEMTNNCTRQKILKLLLYGFVASSTMMAIILFAMLTYDSQLFNFLNVANFSRFIIPYLLYVIFFSFERVVISILTSLLLHKKASIVEIIKAGIRSVLYFFALPILTLQIMLYIEAIIAIYYLIVGLTILTNYIAKKHYQINSLKNTQISKSRIIRYGLYSSLNGLGVGIVSRTSDYYIISSLSGPFQVGLYSFAYQIYSLTFRLVPLNEFYSVLRPLFFQKYSNDKSDEYTDIYNFIIKIMLPIYLFPAIYFMIFGKGIINYIYDPKYIGAYWVTVIVLFAGFSSAIFYPLSLIIMQREKMQYAFYSKIVVVFSIGAGICAMKYIGLEAVAFVTLLGDLFKNLIMFMLIKKDIKIRYKFAELSRYFYLAIALICVFYFPASFVKGTIHLFLQSIIFLVISILAFIKFHPFSKYDLILLSQIKQNLPFKKIAIYIDKIQSYKLFR